MDKYRTFRRSCTNWHEFATAHKMTQSRYLTREEARDQCDRFNDHRTTAQIRRGTKMEFEKE